MSAADMPEPSAADAAATGRGYRYLVLGVLLLIYMINFMDRQLFAVLQEPIRADLNLSDVQLGLLGGTMFAVFYAVAGLPLAYLADRTSRVAVIAASCAAWSGFTALCGLAQAFWQMALARIGVATGEAGGVSPAFSLLADYFPPERRAFAVGLFTAGGPIGLMLGAALGAWIAAEAGWRMAFIALGLPGVAIGLMMLFIVREPGRGRLDAAGPPAAPAKPLDAARTIVSKPTLALVVAGGALTSFAGYGLFQWMPSFLIRSQGMSLDSVAVFFAPILALGALGSFAGGWLVDRYGVKHPAAYGVIPAIGALCAAPLFAAAILAGSAPATLALLILPYVLNFLWIGPTLALLQNLSSANVRASVVAIASFFNNLVGIGLGPLAVGAISDLLRPALGDAEALRVGLLFASLIYIPAGALYLLAARRVRRDSAA